MANVTVSRTIDAPAEHVWALWDDFAHIDRFNPYVASSRLINQSDDTGLGAQRQCDLSDGKNWLRERIIGYTAGKQMVVDIYESSMPLKSSVATLTVKPLGPARSQLTFSMEFEPAMGVIGKLMAPMMKPMFAARIKKLVKASAARVEGGDRRAAMA